MRGTCTRALTKGSPVVACFDRMKKFFSAVTLALVTTALVGCYKTQEGRRRAGIPGIKDTIESRYERPVGQVYESARATLAYNGAITEQNDVARVLQAKVNNRTVWVRVDEVEPNVTRIFVQARRSGARGDITLASEIDKQIALRLR